MLMLKGMLHRIHILCNSSLEHLVIPAYCYKTWAKLPFRKEIGSLVSKIYMYSRQMAAVA